MVKTFRRIADMPKEITDRLRYMVYVESENMNCWQFLCEDMTIEEFMIVFGNCYSAGRSADDYNDSDWHFYEQQVFSLNHSIRMRSFDRDFEIAHELQYDAQIAARKMRNKHA